MSEREPGGTPDSSPKGVQGTLVFESRRILSVSQVTRAIKGQLEREWNGVWIRGEVGAFRPQPSGHLYFPLKDEGATMRIVLWRSTAMKLKFKISEGQEILVRGRVTVFEPKGEYQLVADLVEPVGAGALQLAFEELKKRLAAEGLFDSLRKKPLPFLPRRVGVVTSLAGAALRDILATLVRRAPNVEVLVCPVKVQGDGAAPEIAAGIRRMDAKGAADVMIVGRGGGSLEDLWPFNEEPVARALFHCQTPTISAVGHEVDFTIADFVADRRAATPTAAAEIAVPDRRDLLTRVTGALHRTELAQSRRLARARRGVVDLASRLKDPRRVLEEQRMMVDDLVDRLASGLKRNAAGRRAELVGARRALFAHSPATRLGRARHRLERASASLGLTTEKRLAARRARLAELAGRLDAISPLAVLERGYAMVRDPATGAVLRASSQARVGQSLEVRLGKGTLGVQVERKEE